MQSNVGKPKFAEFREGAVTSIRNGSERLFNRTPVQVEMEYTPFNNLKHKGLAYPIGAWEKLVKKKRS